MNGRQSAFTFTMHMEQAYTFDSVHPVLEGCFLHRHVGDDHGDVAEDGGEDEDAYQEVSCDED